MNSEIVAALIGAGTVLGLNALLFAFFLGGVRSDVQTLKADMGEVKADVKTLQQKVAALEG